MAPLHDSSAPPEDAQSERTHRNDVSPVREPGEIVAPTKETHSLVRQQSIQQPDPDQCYQDVIRDLAQSLQNSELHRNLIRVLAEHPQGMSATGLRKNVPKFLATLRVASKEANVNLISPKRFLLQMPGIHYAEGLFYLDPDFRTLAEEAVSARKRAASSGELLQEKKLRFEQNESIDHRVKEATVKQRGYKDDDLPVLGEETFSEAQREAMHHFLRGQISAKMHKKMLGILGRYPQGLSCREVIKLTSSLQIKLQRAAREVGIGHLPPTPCLRNLPGFVFDRGLFFLDPQFKKITIEQLHAIRRKEFGMHWLGPKRETGTKKRKSSQVSEKESDPSISETTSKLKTDANPGKMKLLAKDFLLLLRGELGHDELEWPDRICTLQTFLQKNYTQATATVELVVWVADQPDTQTATLALFSALRRLSCIEQVEGETIVWNRQKVEEAILFT